jgi:TatD family-associated radical SAM protein
MPQQISYQAGNRLFVQLTDRCTLECRFCPRFGADRRVRGWNLDLDHKPSAAEIIASITDPRQYDEVVFSGLGEPTLRLNVLLETAEDVKRRGGRVRVETDGLANLVHDRNVLPAMAGLIDAVSVSMNAQDEAAYERLCRPNLPGSFAAMRAFLDDALSHIPRVSATAVEGVKGVDIAACAQLAHDIGVSFRARPLHDLP